MKKIKTLSILLMALALCFSFLSVSTYAAQVRLNYSEISVFAGKSKTLKVKGTKNKVTWKSSDKKIATVSKNGKVLGKKAGTAVITATVGGNSYKCTVTVKNPQLNENNLTMAIGDTFKLKVTGAKAKSFRSSNEKVAAISAKGVITAKKAGSAIITVQTGSKKLKCKIKVKKYVLNHSELTLYHDPSHLFVKNDAPSYASPDRFSMAVSLCVQGNYGKKKVKWSSSDKKVATVDNRGIVTIKGFGQAKITAKIGTQKLTCNINVKELRAYFYRTYSDPDSTIKSGWIWDESYTLVKGDVVRYKVEELEYLNGKIIKQRDITKTLKLTPRVKGHFQVNTDAGTIKALSSDTNQFDESTNLVAQLNEFECYSDGSNQESVSSVTSGQQIMFKIFNHERPDPADCLKIELDNEYTYAYTGETISVRLRSDPMVCTFSRDDTVTYYADWSFFSSTDKFTWESGDESIFKVLHVYGNGESHVSRAVIHAVNPGEAVLTAKYDGKVIDTINVKIYR